MSLNSPWPWLIAIPITALSMRGEYIVKMILRRRSQKKICDTMLQLASMARLMVFQALLETYGPARERHVMKISSYLFGDSKKDGEIDDMFSDATKSEAMIWLHANPLWQELVLQTLRVETVATAGKGEISHDDVLTKLINSPVVQVYGENYQTEMNPPKLYADLLKRTLSEASDPVRKAVLQRL